MQKSGIRSASEARSAGALPLLQTLHVSKFFGRATVLSEVSLSLQAGEVHILAGANGAGKSTLIKVLGGVHAPSSGELLLQGQPVAFQSPLDALKAGVAVIHQELSLVGSLSVLDNLHLGRETGARTSRRASAQAILKRLKLDVRLDALVETLPLALQSQLEIAKALLCRARVLILDEPTSALQGEAVEQVLALVRELASQGVAVLYISHRMPEIFRIADRITVLRDGRQVLTKAAAEMSPESLVEAMIGSVPTPSDTAPQGVPEVSTKTTLRLRTQGVDLTLRAGRITALTGLADSGAPELLEKLFGARPLPLDARLELDGRTVSPRGLRPSTQIQRGVAYLPADRKTQGLHLGLDLASNIAMTRWPELSPRGFLKPRRILSEASHWLRTLQVKAQGPSQEVGTLSGGNQQKVALAKWLATRPRILLLNEPTRGVDIGARLQIYEVIQNLARSGVAVALVSSDLDELLTLSHEVHVMHQGRLTRTLHPVGASDDGSVKPLTQQDLLLQTMSHSEAV